MVSEKLVAARRTQRTVAMVLALVAVFALPANARAVHSGAEAEQAAGEIQDARDRANAASQAMFDAESTLDQLAIEIDQKQTDLALANAEADSMRVQLQALAARSFVNGGTASMPLLVDFDDANEALTAEHFASIARGGAAVDLDELDSLMSEIADAQQQLERRQDDEAQAKTNFEQLKARAEAEIVRLAEVEQRRVIDAQVQHELDRQRAAREAAERAAAEREAAAAAAVQRAAVRTPVSGGGGPSAGATSGASASATPSAPTPSPPPPPASNAGSGMVCPVAGPRAFADTWGAARSGGRSHEGVDMMSPGGTPLVAVEAGSANFSTNKLGGNAIWLQGASGTKYYYAHLSSWEGSSRSVSQGEVIGYVGATGNTTANHLHFEVHPGGGRAVNPYPYVRSVC
jgi:murein DD-endopeptidase MepM/ murein hydrolase activator NlpD